MDIRLTQHSGTSSSPHQSVSQQLKLIQWMFVLTQRVVREDMCVEKRSDCSKIQLWVLTHVLHM
eukprot:m.109829 g.109829  ORF g.109829 m.109829 type:complete len:64 (+) comp12740_c0_seq2:1909-2100(+)